MIEQSIIWWNNTQILEKESIERKLKKSLIISLNRDKYLLNRSISIDPCWFKINIYFMYDE